ncbi:MAG: hypothetical protein ACRDPY_05645 [Streptosporangiaceae bacterium]
MTADLVTHSTEPRGGRRRRRLVALAALVLGVAGFAAATTGVAVQLLPRRFSAGQQRQIMTWEVAGRWRTLTAGQIFPASVGYQLSAAVLEDATPLGLQAQRVAIAPQATCAAGVTGTAAAGVLRRSGCEAVLRATYTDATKTYVMTVGVAVLPSATAAVAAEGGLSRPRLAAARDDSAGQLAADVLAIRFRGVAGGYDFSRQISASFTAGPYVIMYAAGYADNRPRVQVSDDGYADAEMTSLARGVAQAVAATLGAQPPTPHCPGAPGC